MVTWRKWGDRGPACVTWVILTWNNKQRKQKITQNIHTKTNTQNKHTKTNTQNRHTKKNIQKDRNTNTYAYILHMCRTARKILPLKMIYGAI